MTFDRELLIEFGVAFGWAALGVYEARRRARSRSRAGAAAPERSGPLTEPTERENCPEASEGSAGEGASGGASANGKHGHRKARRKGGSAPRRR